MQEASSKQQTKQEYKSSHQQTGLPPHSALPIRGEREKKKLSINLTLYKAYTNHWTNLRRAETKRKKEFNLIQGKKEMAIHSSTLAWKITWAEESDGLQSMESQRVGHD